MARTQKFDDPQAHEEELPLITLVLRLLYFAYDNFEHQCKAFPIGVLVLTCFPFTTSPALSFEGGEGCKYTYCTITYSLGGRSRGMGLSHVRDAGSI